MKLKNLFSIDAWLEAVGIKDFKKRREIRTKWINVFAFIIISLIIWAIVFIPAYIAFAIRWMVAPIGEFPRLLLSVAEIAVFGTMQVIFVVVGVFATIHMFFSDY